MRKFQILAADKTTLTLNQVDEIVAKFWGVEVDSKEWAKPSNGRWAMNWYDTVGWHTATNPACINFNEIAEQMNQFFGGNIAATPHIELAKHFNQLGLIPVCL